MKLYVIIMYLLFMIKTAEAQNTELALDNKWLSNSYQIWLCTDYKINQATA